MMNFCPTMVGADGLPTLKIVCASEACFTPNPVATSGGNEFLRFALRHALMWKLRPTDKNKR